MCPSASGKATCFPVQHPQARYFSIARPAQVAIRIILSISIQNQAILARRDVRSPERRNADFRWLVVIRT